MAVLYNKTKGCYVDVIKRENGDYSLTINSFVKEKQWEATDVIVVTTVENLPEAVKKCNHTAAISNYLNMKDMF